MPVTRNNFGDRLSLRGRGKTVLPNPDARFRVVHGTATIPIDELTGRVKRVSKKTVRPKPVGAMKHALDSPIVNFFKKHIGTKFLSVSVVARLICEELEKSKFVYQTGKRVTEKQYGLISERITQLKKAGIISKDYFFGKGGSVRNK
ncbi:MAG: hypothetical protein PHQ98_01240 [Candidatus ainarchaeum sp.]|nr:hypothetical protein [Candidatus ainarchaeum sp.]